MNETETGTPRWTRRGVLLAGAGALGFAALPAGAAAAAKNLIFILCSGAPSQLETWDPKPDAPREVRGPFGAIPSQVAGIRISATLPRLARMADRYALIRSLHSPAPAVHEPGYQQIQTGRLFEPERPWPHLGSVLARARGASGGMPGHVVLPEPLHPCGLDLPLGQDAGFLGPQHDPVIACELGRELLTARGLEPWESGRLASQEPLVRSRAGAAFDLTAEPRRLRERYGASTFGRSCLLARRLIERGTRCVTINQFPSLYHTQSWDCHGLPDLPTRVSDLDRVAAPFDRAVSALIEDLTQRGLYAETLVCCFGEFGRAPRIDERGGRDHWSGCWSVMLGGGGIRGGQVIGASDGTASAPAERPVTPGELFATLYEALNLAPDGLLPAGTRPIAGLL